MTEVRALQPIGYMHRITRTFQALWCSSADVESVMNSIVSLLLILETEKQEALIESLCEKLVKFREGERPSLRMQL